MTEVAAISHTLHRRLYRAVSPALLIALLMPMAAFAHTPRSGGAAYVEPEVRTLKCAATGDARSCPRGAVLRLSGENLADTTTVIFLGAPGSRDDRRARTRTASQHRVLVAIPAAARSGPLRVVGDAAATVAPRLKVLPVAAPPPFLPGSAAAGGSFPVQGVHDYGTAVNRFGGGRDHQGQDILAACGTPLVAALAGEVTLTRFEERAGHYVVIKADDGTSQAYMHMLEAATVSKGDRVAAGQAIGRVGQTGRTTACHLHFELWSAPGWYEGGKAVDPLPFLQGLDDAA